MLATNSCQSIGDHLLSNFQNARRRFDKFASVRGQSDGELSMETKDHTSLGFFFGAKETSDGRCLKTTNEQEKLYRSLMEQNSSSLHLLCQLAPRSEYLSRQVAFRLIELNMEHKLSNELLQGILPSVPEPEKKRSD